jgi:hypothetical protein
MHQNVGDRTGQRWLHGDREDARAADTTQPGGGEFDPLAVDIAKHRAHRTVVVFL